MLQIFGNFRGFFFAREVSILMTAKACAPNPRLSPALGAAAVEVTATMPALRCPVLQENESRATYDVVIRQVYQRTSW